MNCVKSHIKIGKNNYCNKCRLSRASSICTVIVLGLWIMKIYGGNLLLFQKWFEDKDGSNEDEDSSNENS